MEFRRILNRMEDKQCFPVEDLKTLGENPYDFRRIALAMRYAMDNYRMVMEVGRQKAGYPGTVTPKTFERFADASTQEKIIKALAYHRLI
jgi:hypothetical protein